MHFSLFPGIHSDLFAPKIRKAKDEKGKIHKIKNEKGKTNYKILLNYISPMLRINSHRH